MKKILLFTALLFIPALIFAQNSHLQFKGIPIDGTMNQFIGKLKGHGFVLKETLEDITLLSGEFVNETCDIYVLASPKTNVVWKVVVCLPKETSWNSIKSSYRSFQNSFTSKYGDPTESIEFFNSPYQEVAGTEMLALRSGECTYMTYWDIPEGTIVIKMLDSEQIAFMYEDKINTEKRMKEKEESILNDI